MSVYAITYDLHGPSKDYENLFEELKSFGPYSHPLESFWFVDTNLEAKEIRDRLKNVMDSDDSLLVFQVRCHWASWNIPKSHTDWLKSENRNF
ncbi:MAG: hypothetical protein ACLTXM_11970 [Enterococcus sp.]